MKKNPILFPVSKVDSTEVNPDFEYARQVSKAIVAHLPEGDKVLNYCSPTYELVPNSDILLPFEKELGKSWDFDANYKHRDNKRFYIDYTIKDMHMNIKGMKKDALLPMITVHNSYDGGLRYGLFFGFMRLVCSNGMMVRDETKEHGSFKMRHTPALGDGQALSEAMNAIGSFIKESASLLDDYNNLASVPVLDIGERLVEIQENTKFPLRQLEAAAERITLEMEQFNMDEANDWLVYNGLNYQLNHNNEVKMQEHKKEKLDRQILDFMVK